MSNPPPTSPEWANDSSEDTIPEPPAPNKDDSSDSDSLEMVFLEGTVDTFAKPADTVSSIGTWDDLPNTSSSPSHRESRSTASRPAGRVKRDGSRPNTIRQSMALGSSNAHNKEDGSRRTSVKPQAEVLSAEEQRIRALREQVDFKIHRVIFLPAMTIIQIVVFAIAAFTNGFVPYEMNPLIGPDQSVLIEFGAKSTPLIVGGQVYRLITPIFMHVGVIHLAINMYIQLYVGWSIEKFHGFLPVAAVYFASGFGGNLLSALLLSTRISCGASSAIFGIFAVMMVDLIQNWSILPGRCQSAVFLLLSIIVCLAMGLLPGVDAFAHIGGYIWGLLLSIAIMRRLKKKRSNTKICMAISCAIILVVLSILLTIVLFRSGGIQCQICQTVNCIEAWGWCDF